jgi:UDP-N-acetylglucosamine--N-acetylmuramyl-(pentapeptide) pyrophosphoryl-undecaprenol N-acetylglucosamine transferase
MSVKIILAGGGTGGHIFPAIAIANAIRKQQPNAEILFVGAKGKMKWKKCRRPVTTLRGWILQVLTEVL